MEKSLAGTISVMQSDFTDTVQSTFPINPAGNSLAFGVIKTYSDRNRGINNVPHIYSYIPEENTKSRRVFISILYNIDMEERRRHTVPRIDEPDEYATAIASLRKNWHFLSASEDGELYQTPRGKYLLEKNEDGSTKRLQLINE